MSYSVPNAVAIGGVAPSDGHLTTLWGSLCHVWPAAVLRKDLCMYESRIEPYKISPW